MDRQATPEQKLEAAFHQRLKRLVGTRMQGYIMGAFREAVAEVDAVQAEPVVPRKPVKPVPAECGCVYDLGHSRFGTCPGCGAPKR